MIQHGNWSRPILSALLVMSLLTVSSAGLLQTALITAVRNWARTVYRAHRQTVWDFYRNPTRTDDLMTRSLVADDDTDLLSRMDKLSLISINRKIVPTFVHKYRQRYNFFRSSLNETAMNAKDDHNFPADMVDTMSFYGISGVLTEVVTYLKTPRTGIGIFPFDVLLLIFGSSFKLFDYTVGAFFLTALYYFVLNEKMEDWRSSLPSTLDIEPNGAVATHIGWALPLICESVLLVVIMNVIRFLRLWFVSFLFQIAIFCIIVIGVFWGAHWNRNWKTEFGLPLPPLLPARTKDMKPAPLHIDPFKYDWDGSPDSPTTPKTPDSPGIDSSSDKAKVNRMSADIEDDSAYYKSSSWQISKLGIVGISAALSGLLAFILI